MITLHYPQKTLLKIIAWSSFFTTAFWLVFFWRATVGFLILILVGIAILFAQIFMALFYGSRIRRKILFEGRLKQKLRKLREQLKLTEQNSQRIKDHLFEGIIIVDEQSRIISVNRPVRRLLKFRTNVRNLSLLEVVREPEIHELILSVKREKKPIEKTLTIFGVNKIDLLARASLLSKDRILISLLDTTHVNSINEKHNNFIAHASHELKTPISVILANAEILNEILEDVKIKTLLLAIHRQAIKARKLLDSLLELLRLDGGGHKVIPARIKLFTLIHDIKTSLGQMGEIIENNVPIDMAVFVDRTMLERLILIIVENAHKYAGTNAKLSISAFAQKHNLKIQFKDDGPGIRPHLRERVFERFFRQPEHEQSDKEGFGLGLSQARALAFAMGGRIFVDDKVEKGCTMVLLLPERSSYSSFANRKANDKFPSPARGRKVKDDGEMKTNFTLTPKQKEKRSVE